MENNNNECIKCLYLLNMYGYDLANHDIKEFKSDYQIQEEKYLNSFNMKKINEAYNFLKKKNLSNRLIDIILNIDNINPVLLRIKNLINNRMFNNRINKTNIHKSLELNYKLNNYIEKLIRSNYYCLITKHLENTKKATNYRTTTNNIIQELIFIYNDYNTSLTNEEKIDVNIKSYDLDNFINKYLYEYSIEIIKIINSCNDIELEDEHNYAIIDNLQYVLRGIYLIIDNDKTLANINNEFNNFENRNNTIANGIIKSSFINN